MSQVKLLSIDVMQNTEVASDTSLESSVSSDDFSKLVDKQMQSQQATANTATDERRQLTDRQATASREKQLQAEQGTSVENEAEHELTSGEENKTKVDDVAKPSTEQANDTETVADNTQNKAAEAIASEASDSNEFMALLARSEKWLSKESHLTEQASEQQTKQQAMQKNIVAQLNGEATSQTEQTAEQVAEAEDAALNTNTDKLADSIKNALHSDGKLPQQFASDKQGQATNAANATKVLDMQNADSELPAGEQLLNADGKAVDGKTVNGQTLEKAGLSAQQLAKPLNSQQIVEQLKQAEGQQAAQVNALQESESLNVNLEADTELSSDEELARTLAGLSQAKLSPEGEKASVVTSAAQKLAGTNQTEQSAGSTIKAEHISGNGAAQPQTDEAALDAQRISEQVATHNQQSSQQVAQQAASVINGQSTNNQQTTNGPSAHVQQLAEIVESTAESVRQTFDDLNQQNNQAEFNQENEQANLQQQQTVLPRSTFAQSLTAATQVENSHTTISAEQAKEIEAIANQVIDSNQALKKTQQVQLETINIYRRDFANAVKDKVMVMISQKLQQVDIQLDPPELGNVHVRVNLQGEQATVNFTVQNPQAKEAFEQQMDKLRDMLQESGVDVGDANVAEQHGENNQQQSGMASNGQGEVDDSVMINENLVNLVNPSATGIDFYA